MKALVLEIYEKGVDHHGNVAYLDGGEFFYPEALADEDARETRLTGPELAAEYWRADGDATLATEGIGVTNLGTWSQREAATLGRLRVLERFAILPHYDEATDRG